MQKNIPKNVNDNISSVITDYFYGEKNKNFKYKLHKLFLKHYF